MLKEAWPVPSTAMPEARVVVPSVKATVPVGTPAPEATVAVKVTGLPKAEGLGVELTVVVVALALWTTCVMPPPLAAKRLSEA